MSTFDSRCDDCDSKELQPLLDTIGGFRICLCRKCAGQAAYRLIKYVKEFDVTHPKKKIPKDVSRPIISPHGTIRCRGCEAQLFGWESGMQPYCAGCEERREQKVKEGSP